LEGWKIGILGKPVVYPPFHYSIVPVFHFLNLCDLCDLCGKRFLKGVGNDASGSVDRRQLEDVQDHPGDRGFLPAPQG
jgi:hypothetical protein